MLFEGCSAKMHQLTKTSMTMVVVTVLTSAALTLEHLASVKINFILYMKDSEQPVLALNGSRFELQMLCTLSYNIWGTTSSCNTPYICCTGGTECCSCKPSSHFSMCHQRGKLENPLIQERSQSESDFLFCKCSRTA